MVTVAETNPNRGLLYRNALHDWDHVAPDLVFQGQDQELPLVTIAIPTFQRLDLLTEAVQSALSQRFDRPFEIVVMDDDPASRNAEALLQRLPVLKEANFRYYVNRENIGIFGNFNRCIGLARGEWLTILNDDDLLDENYLELMIAVLDRRPDVDGLVCRQRYLRMETTHTSPAGGPLSKLVGGRAAWRRAVARLARLPLYAWHFGGGRTRRLFAPQFFWGPIAGSLHGFIWRKRCSVAIGGFYHEEFPAADLWFYARFASRYHLRQLRVCLATARILENESANPQTVVRSLQSVQRLQQALTAKEAPRRLLKFGPLVLARLRSSAERAFGTAVPDDVVERALGINLGPDRPLLLAMMRLLCGGWHPDPA